MDEKKKVIDYKLESFDKGKQETINVKIRFVSHKALEMFQDLKELEFQVTELWEECKEIIEEMAFVKVSDKSDKRKILRELKAERKEKEKEIKRISNKVYFKRRLEVISFLLEQNDIKDERLFKADFWENNLSPEDMQKFLSTVIYKDFDLGKQKGQKVSGK